MIWNSLGNIQLKNISFIESKNYKKTTKFNKIKIYYSRE